MALLLVCLPLCLVLCEYHLQLGDGLKQIGSYKLVMGIENRVNNMVRTMYVVSWVLEISGRKPCKAYDCPTNILFSWD